MTNNLKKAIFYVKQHGLLALFWRIVFSGENPLLNKSIVKNYAELFGNPFGRVINASEVSPKTINWFIPPVGKGSGGHLNIFRFIKNLEDLGFESRIVIVGGKALPSARVIKNNITKWFFPLRAEVYVGVENDIPPAYFAMATSWPTAYYVKRYLACVKKCYFVQDFEPLFYPSGTESILAENTYKFGFDGITAGTWLADKLSEDYGMATSSVGFSVEKDLYKPIPEARTNDGTKRVFFYARPPTERRAFELGMLVLNEVCKSRTDIKVILAGWELGGYEIPFPHEKAGLVELEKLATLYAKCDVALVLSLSNVSLLPLELMACDVPVVSNKAPCTEWLLSPDNCMMSEPSIEALKEAILKVLDDNLLADTLKKSGRFLAESSSWVAEATKFASILDGLSNQVNVE